MGISYHTAFTYLSLTPIAIFKPDPSPYSSLTPIVPRLPRSILRYHTSNLQRDRGILQRSEPACQPGCAH